MKSTKVICISGKAQHGKDTTASILKQFLEDHGNKVLIAHYGDLVKYVCKTFFEWDGVKDEAGRTLLQYVGTDVIRYREPDYWVEFVAKIINMFDSEWDYVLIPDTRFPNEVEVIHNYGFNPIHLRVVRNNFVSPLTEEQQRHPSETSLDEYGCDHLIENCGTIKDLEDIVCKWAYETLVSVDIPKDTTDTGNIYHQFTMSELGLM